MAETRTVNIGGVEVHCPICTHGEFTPKKLLMSSGVGPEAVVLSSSDDRTWTHKVKDGETPDAEVCSRCGYVLLFVRATETRS